MTIKWSYSYNLFVKLSLNNIMYLLITPSFTMDPKHDVNGLHCITTALIAQLAVSAFGARDHGFESSQHHTKGVKSKKKY